MSQHGFSPSWLTLGHSEENRKAEPRRAEEDIDKEEGSRSFRQISSTHGPPVKGGGQQDSTQK